MLHIVAIVAAGLGMHEVTILHVTAIQDSSMTVPIGQLHEGYGHLGGYC